MLHRVEPLTGRQPPAQSEEALGFFDVEDDLSFEGFGGGPCLFAAEAAEEGELEGEHLPR